jgi:hypothetical protein
MDGWPPGKHWRLAGLCRTGTGHRLGAALERWGAQMSWSELAGGMPQIGDFLSRSVPPDWSILPRLWAPALETIQIAIWGTLLSVILALPLSFVPPAICTAGTGCAASRASFST